MIFVEVQLLLLNRACSRCESFFTSEELGTQVVRMEVEALRAANRESDLLDIEELIEFVS